MVEAKKLQFGSFGIDDPAKILSIRKEQGRVVLDNGVEHLTIDAPGQSLSEIAGMLSQTTPFARITPELYVNANRVARVEGTNVDVRAYPLGRPSIQVMSVMREAAPDGPFKDSIEKEIRNQASMRSVVYFDDNYGGLPVPMPANEVINKINAVRSQPLPNNQTPGAWR